MFFALGESHGGHTAVLALFGPDSPRSATIAAGERSSLHHLALSLPRSEQAAVERWYDQVGLEYRIEEFAWIGWRGIFTKDPEGNTVELVSFDLHLRAEPGGDHAMRT